MRIPAALLAFVCLSQIACQRPASSPVVDRSPFPDFAWDFEPSPYTGSEFSLSQDYPATVPDASRKPAFFNTDFRGDWYNYMTQARAYCFEGNTPGWIVQNNPVRKWYHMPWQHFGTNGREALHGLTKEARVSEKQLGPNQSASGDQSGEGQTYAVGMFNEFAGYAIGVVWRDHMNPSLEEFNAMGGFPEGSVICKTLYINIPDQGTVAVPDQSTLITQVPYLARPLQLQAYITTNFDAGRRTTKTVTLIQMDIMAKDKRAPGGWVYGTYVYNGQLGNSNQWDNLVPEGIMWGNDPGVVGTTFQYDNPTPTVTKVNPDLKETIVNTRMVNGKLELPPTHLGWNGRLAGPVDNPSASCMSCHMTAEYPQVRPNNPTFQAKANIPAEGSSGWMSWFQNLPCNMPFDTNAKSTDSSLQLAIALQNFETWKKDQDGAVASPAAAPASPTAVPSSPTAAPKSPTAAPKAKPSRILR
jgi:hypothetical protein